MKKLLIGGVISCVLPAMALADSGLDISSLINVSEEPLQSQCSGTAFQGDHDSEHPLQMAAVYVDGCDAGTYLKVADDAAIGNDGTLTGVSCEPCDTGHFCTKLDAENISITNNILTSQTEYMTECEPGTYSDVTGLANCKQCEIGTFQSEYGEESCDPADAHYYVDEKGASEQQECPDGYKDGTETGGTSIYSCQKKITSCGNANTGYASNFKIGSLTTAVLPEDGKLVNYRDLSNHCFGSLTCTAGTHEQNVWQWVVEHPESAVHMARCGIDGTMLSGGNYVDCDNDLEPGTIKLTIDPEDSNRPLNSINMVFTCSNRPVNENNEGVIKFGDQEYDNFTRVPYKCYDANGDVIAAATTQTACEEIDNATWQSPDLGPYCWGRNVDLPNQAWLSMGHFGTVADCEKQCAEAFSDVDYPFVILNVDGYPVVRDQNDGYYAIVNKKFVLQVENDGVYVSNGPAQDTIGEYSYLTNNGMLNTMSYLYSISADDDNANICVNNNINIAWGDVTLNENDPAKTCTFGGDLVTPQDAPVQEPGDNRLFLGWKPMVTTTPEPAPAPMSGD